MQRKVVVLSLLAALVFALVSSVSASASSLAEQAARADDALRAQRLRNLAETIAELQSEAAQEADEEVAQHQHEMRSMVQLASANQTDASATNSTSSTSNSTAAAPSAPGSSERATPQYQGTNRADLVALWRFDTPANPGRGFGGPGRNLRVFGKGIQVVTGADAKRGKGSLFIPSRPTAAPATIDPSNPYQNSFLARDSKGTPIKGLPLADSSFTIAAWYKVVPTKPGRYSVSSFGVLENNQANLLQVTSNGRAISSFKTGLPLKSNATRDTVSTWHHAAVTYDKATGLQTLYTDGVITAQRTVNRAPQVTPGSFFLGVSANVPESEQFSGFLDDVAIFRAALNQEEVLNIKKGKFHPYLDLFSLRNCRTRLGRRQHGAGFVLGAEDESISVNNKTKKYGFEAANAFECSVLCARTTNCRQSVFIASPLPVGAANSTAAPSSRRGQCYLQSVKYSTYEADKSATSTVCDAPSDYLQKNSFLLKPSADFEPQLAKRMARIAREKIAAEEKKRKEEEQRLKIEAKKVEEARAAEKKAHDAEEAKAAEAKKEAVKKAAAYSAAKAAQAEAAKSPEQKAAEAKKAEEAKKMAEFKAEEKRRIEAEEAHLPPAERQARRDARLLAERKAAREAAERKGSQEARLERLEREQAKAALEKKLNAKYAARIQKLKDNLTLQQSKLSETKLQADHRALVETKRTARLIAKLEDRLARVTKKLAEKEERERAAALAKEIKATADKKAAELIAKAKAEAKNVRLRARRAHLKRRAEKAKGKKKLTKAERKALKKAAKKRAADKKLKAKLQAKAAKAAKKKAAESKKQLKKTLAKAAKLNKAPAKAKQAAKVKPTRPNLKQNKGHAF